MSTVPLTGGDTFEGGLLEITEGQKHSVRLSDGLLCCGAALLAFVLAEGPEVFK